MPVSPPAAGQVESELRRSQTQCCDLAPGGCPASCPDAHRPTHGHRHVRNWAIAHISDVSALDKNFFCHEAPAADRRGVALAKFAATAGQLRVVNGSTRRALRMKATITAMPQRKKMPCMICTPYGPKSK